MDLVEHMAASRMALAGLRVVELGCGVAAPGIHALQMGAHVDFQDYVR